MKTTFASGVNGCGCCVCRPVAGGNDNASWSNGTNGALGPALGPGSGPAVGLGLSLDSDGASFLFNGSFFGANASNASTAFDGDGQLSDVILIIATSVILGLMILITVIGTSFFFSFSFSFNLSVRDCDI